MGTWLRDGDFDLWNGGLASDHLTPFVCLLQQLAVIARPEERRPVDNIFQGPGAADTVSTKPFEA